ncbi:aminopeptidase P family protein [Alicyclobacillus vulcanalis]|uniref:Xaa-Pro aminopeptidase n=1 Tax=Alicyclobacillus vulcanalis TaxID=252246 RepID=A0A1N7LHS0_9BACL|nr:aminopeptidase P family protein [Alicyclobacillus vulcanalis]SIS73336.1 aminopeptidase P Metallo peptidase. MEROPS family M24B [Alicyclobacillus vulcanalis]
MTESKHPYTARREQLLRRLPEGSVALFFAGQAPPMSGDHAYGPFHVNRNFFYLTGITQEHSRLLLAKLNGSEQVTLFTEHVSEVEEKWTGKRLADAQAREISGIQDVQDLAQFETVLGRLLRTGEYEWLYLDVEQDRYHQLETEAHRFARVFRDKYPGIQIRNPYAELCRMRTVKDDVEIQSIRRAIDITREGVIAMMKSARPGMREYELEAHFDFALRSRGVREHAFPPIVAGGERACVLHYVDNDQVIEDGQLVLCDLGAQYGCYAADITRTFPISGKFTPRQREIYNIVLAAMEATIEAIRPGVTTSELNDVTKAVLAQELKRIGLIQEDSEVARYYYHGVSHRLGLDTHDVGSPKWPLEAGDVITVEPGLYIAEEGIGIRIEDDVLVTEDGPVNLSSDIPKDPDEIERIMRG